MALSRETVKYVADLSRIELNADEIEKLSKQLEAIVDFIDKLKGLDVKDKSPTSHILPVSNIFRDDTLKESLPLQKVLSNAPDRQGDFFAVPKVIE